MKRPRMRSIVCGSIAGACLCGGLFVQAGPMGFVSRMWKERPVILKSGESRLNPVNWFRRSENDEPETQVSSAERIKVERPELERDPFLTDTLVVDEVERPAPQAEPEIKVARPYREPGAELPSNRAPLAVEENVAEAPAPANSIASAAQAPEPTARRRPVQSRPDPRAVADSIHRAPRLPDLGGTAEPVADQTDRFAPSPEDLPFRQPVTAKTQPRPKPRATAPAAPQTGGNQFVNGFDAEFSRLVQSVIAETESETVSAPVPRFPENTSAILPSDALAPSFMAPDRSADEQAGLVTLMPQSDGNSSVANRTPPATPAKPGEFSTQDELQEFARYGRQLTGQSIEEVIEDSRQRMADTPLATRRNSGNGQLTAGQYTGPQVRQIESAAPPAGIGRDEQLEMLQAPMMQITPGRAGSGVVVNAPRSRPVRPRVTSNGAPRRSVPSTSSVERLSYQTDELLADGSMGQPDDAPMMLPAEDGLNGQQFLDRADNVAADPAAAEEATMPPINFQFPTETEAAPSEGSSGIGWVIAVICLMLVVSVGGYLARRKLRIDSIDLTRIRPRFEKE